MSSLIHALGLDERLAAFKRFHEENPDVMILRKPGAWNRCGASKLGIEESGDRVTLLLRMSFPSDVTEEQFGDEVNRTLRSLLSQRS